jgi:hypothetical protein
MKHMATMLLWQRTGKGWDIVSRGGIVNICGDDCTYVGPAPDMTSYFWLRAGDCRCLTLEQLENFGYTLSETYPRKEP